MTNDKDNDLFYEKIKVYSEKSIPIHITLQNDSWLNGFVKEVKTDFFMLEEFKNGLMPVFFSELKFIETYTKEKK
jgi:hypothetical protein